jgi:hypothetical protein
MSKVWTNINEMNVLRKLSHVTGHEIIQSSDDRMHRPLKPWILAIIGGLEHQLVVALSEE